MSDNSLLEHRRGDFHEAGHICPLEVVHRAVRPEAELHALLVDILHDPMQLAVHFSGRPTDMGCILGHFKTRCCHSACIDGLSRSENHPIVLEEMDGFRTATHVGNLTAAPAAVGFEGLCIFLIQFVLESARKSYVTRNRPGFLSRNESRPVRELHGHVLDPVPIGGPHFEHIFIHLAGDSVRDAAHSVRSGDCNDLCTELIGLLDKLLTAREKEIIFLRYGLACGREVTQREIGEMLHISRSYVSRIEKRALQKLREGFAN